MRRLLSVGIDEDAGAEAIATAERHEQVLAAVGRHPNGAGGFDDDAAARLERLAAHPRVAAVGETGLDYYRDRAPRDDQRRAFRAQIAIARRLAKPLVIHVRDGGRTTDGEALAETFATLRDEADGVTVILHCFSAPPERAVEAGRRAGTARSPATSPTRARPRCARPPPRSPSTCCWSRPTPRSSPRRPLAGGRTSRQTWSPSPSSSPRSGALLSAARGDRRGERRREPSAGEQVARLGQNFLADPNLLAAIVREAGPIPATSCSRSAAARAR